MKQPTKIFLIFIAALFIITASCKKYEDGPLLSLHSKEHRVVGEWDVEYFEINGFDSTSYLKSQPLYGTYMLGKPDHGYPGYFVYNCYDSTDADTSHSYSQEGDWEFSEKKFFLTITSDYEFPQWRHFNIGPYGAHGKVVWGICRLKEEELWIKTNYQGRNFFVKFKLKSE